MAGKRTIEDIARLAGVSKATVSRVLNRKPDVDPQTRERILQIIEAEGFVPSITASGLAAGRSRLIGILIPPFTWPLIPDIMRGISEVIGGTTYELVLYSINETMRGNDKGEVLNRILPTGLTAGLLAIYPGASAKYVGRLHRQGFPVVMIDDQDILPSVPWVGADSRAGAYTATRHLISLGHRRIAHIQGPLKYLCSRERHHGYLQAMEEAHLWVNPDLVIEGDFESTGGYQAAQRLLTLPAEQRPTAIFAASDPMAYGVMAAAEEQCIRIPEDLALVGFDDIASSSHVRPALTTIRQPFYEMGQQSIKLLLTLLEQQHFPGAFYSHYGGYTIGNDAERGSTSLIHLPTNLVIRTSCGSPQPDPISARETAS